MRANHIEAYGFIRNGLPVYITGRYIPADPGSMYGPHPTQASPPPPRTSRYSSTAAARAAATTQSRAIYR